MTLARSIAILLLALVVGLVGYQIGIMQNVAAQVPAGAAGTAPAYYWYGPHMFWGFPFFGFLGFLFPLFFFFVIFGLIRAAVWGGRGWGYGRYERRRQMLEDIHRELHGEKPSSNQQPPAS